MEAFACAGASALFAFLHAPVACEESDLFEGGAAFGICFFEGAREAMRDGAGLAVGAAALHADGDVILALDAEDLQGTCGGFGKRLGVAVFVEAAGVDGDCSSAGGDAHAGRGGFAAPDGDKCVRGVFAHVVSVKGLVRG